MLNFIVFLTEGGFFLAFPVFLVFSPILATMQECQSVPDFLPSVKFPDFGNGYYEYVFSFS